MPSILVTGGTGSFGNAFVRSCLEVNSYSKIVVFSRDELKQYEMRNALGTPDRVRWFLGDIRDKDRLAMAMHGIDVVVHAAALKQVDTAEYNPIEFAKTNVFGSQNIVEMAIESGVKKVIALSTDKASSPINLYGATKLVADKLFIASNVYGLPRGTAFSVVRYGNVMNSRGSVVPFFRQLKSLGRPLPLTDVRMTRFWMKLEQAVELVHYAIQNMLGGELFVPQIPSIKIVDLCAAIDPNLNFEIVGTRPGEKLHEEMISLEEGRRTEERDGVFIIHPYGSKSSEFGTGQSLGEGFRYASDSNSWWLDVSEISGMLSTID